MISTRIAVVVGVTASVLVLAAPGAAQNEERYKVLVQYRTGDLMVPKVDQTEPLEIACRHFIDCIQKGEKPITDGVAGLRDWITKRRIERTEVEDITSKRRKSRRSVQ